MTSTRESVVEVKKLPNEFYAEIVCEAVNVSEKRFVAALDAVATCLFVLDGAQGAQFSADPKQRRVTFGFVLVAEDELAAGREASNLARTALHASGGATPSWTGNFRVVESSQKLLVTA
ncbi:hypothetical protein [Herbiconiux ginsengi]|uniref:Uncharacterized protein n=1 Tax=Herbiconiux ginsengi TaxID=381665 RepID=A0A1H3KBA1_9MICO|nr:hypothetical protein [Herbiconiux ginsengi]SDY49431.1 hypothetical protein SAMN05216554_0493 [Herbiconiux ginsengi]